MDTHKSDPTVAFRDIEKLTEGKWISWSRSVRMSLCAQGIHKYIDGTSSEPSDEKEKARWLEINDKIVGALGLIVDTPLQRELETISTVKGAWDYIEGKYNAKTLSTKLKHMQTAIRSRFSRNTPVMRTMMEIEDAMDTIFEKGVGPTREEWLSILIMNALSDEEYEWLKKDLLSFIINLSIKVTVKDIKTRIEADERERKSGQEETAMVAQGKRAGKRSNITCFNCNKCGHTKAQCWEKGGGAEGKGPKNKKGKQTVAAMESESEPKTAAIAQTDGSSSEWSCAAIEECLVMDQGVTQTGKPFHLDTGASSHCTPFKTNFTELNKIDPKTIRGIGGHIIKARAHGTVNLMCDTGEVLTLKNVLYTPESELRLISIGKLCDDVNVEFLF